MKINTLLILSLLILFYSCSSSKTIAGKKPTYEEKLDSLWIGKNKHDVYIDFGIPNRIIDDGEYGEILAYDKTEIHNTTKTYTTTTKITNSKNIHDTQTNKSESDYPITYTTVNSTQFFINKSGKVYKCKYFDDL